MSDYADLFRDIIAPHLHRLVELVKGSNYRRVLIHEWVLGIEYNWIGYAHNEDDDTSEFVPRLSFWMGGLRDKFNSNPSKKQVIDLLYKTFDASTYCYFDYGARLDVERQIDKYCTQVDNWFGEKILTPKLDRFRLSKKVIPFINTNLDILQKYNSELGSSNLEISKEIQNASGLEKEFSSMFKILMDEYIKVMMKDTDSFTELNKYFDSFLEDCKELGYSITLSKKQKTDMENIKQKIDLKNLIQDTKDILKGTFDIETHKINKIIDSDSQFTTIRQEISIEVSSQIIEQLKKDIQHFNKLIKDIESTRKLWDNYSIKLFTEKQDSEIKDLKKLLEEKKLLKEIITNNYNKLKSYELHIKNVEKHSSFANIFSESLKPIDNKIILNDVFNIFIDALKRNPKDGNDIIEKAGEFIKATSNSFSIKNLESEFNNIKNISHLKIKIVNLFKIPKKDLTVVIMHGSKKIASKDTDANGEIIFDDIPKGELIIQLIKNKKEYSVSIAEYYNEKTIWLFSL